MPNQLLLLISCCWTIQVYLLLLSLTFSCLFITFFCFGKIVSHSHVRFRFRFKFICDCQTNHKGNKNKYYGTILYWSRSKTHGRELVSPWYLKECDWKIDSSRNGFISKRPNKIINCALVRATRQTKLNEMKWNEKLWQQIAETQMSHTVFSSFFSHK